MASLIASTVMLQPLWLKRQQQAIWQNNALLVEVHRMELV